MLGKDSGYVVNFSCARDAHITRQHNMNTPNEDSVKVGQIWFDMINNEPIQLEHNFPCMGVSGYNGDFSNEGDVIPFNKMRKATGEEVMQWRTIRRAWKEAQRDDS